jgi:CHRD domain
MQNKTLAALAAVGITAAIAIPSIAFGNAQRTDPIGALTFLKDSQTPLLAQMSGANEVPAVTTTATGAVAVTLDIPDPTDVTETATMCFDATYSGIVGTPTLAHIHRGAAGASGPPVVPAAGSLPNLGATSASGCVLTTGVLAAEIMGNPGGFYFNVHSTAHGTGEIRGQLAAGPAPSGEAHMLPAPLRAYDSRLPAGAAKIAPNETRTVSLASGKDAALVSFIAVPPGATGAIVTLTVTETGTGVGGAGGFLTLYSAALTAQPSTSTINWAGADQNLATTTQVAVDATGSVKVSAGGNSTHFVIDVIGYTF